VPGRTSDLVVAELGDHDRALALLGAAVGRHRGRRRDRELLVDLQELALDGANAPQVVAERQGRARADADLHVLPVLPRGVVDDGPALEHDLAVTAEGDAVRRLPHRRLGHVGQEHVGGLPGLGRGRDVEGHLEERPTLGLLAREADRQRGLGLGVDHGQGLQEVVDPIARHAHRQLAALDLGPALVEGDAVAIDHDLAQGDLVDLDEGRALGRRGAGGGGDGRGEQEGGQELAHGTSRRRGATLAGPTGPARDAPDVAVRRARPSPGLPAARFLTEA
jgi:hypothetical protein